MMNFEKLVVGTNEVTNKVSSNLTVAVQDNIEQKYSELVKLIKDQLTDTEILKDNDKLNAIISKHIDIFNKDLAGDKEQARKTLKCLQSKRCRAKSKDMTLETVHIIVKSAAAELLLKKAFDLVSTSTSTGLNYDIDNMNAEQLRKAVKNVQSRKSIMKGKADFDDTSEEWTNLLLLEEQLKTKRDGATVPIRMKEIIQQDVSDLNKKQLVALFDELKSMVE